MGGLADVAEADCLTVEEPLPHIGNARSETVTACDRQS